MTTPKDPAAQAQQDTPPYNPHADYQDIIYDAAGSPVGSKPRNPADDIAVANRQAADLEDARPTKSEQCVKEKFTVPTERQTLIDKYSPTATPTNM